MLAKPGKTNVSFLRRMRSDFSSGISLSRSKSQIRENTGTGRQGTAGSDHTSSEEVPRKKIEFSRWHFGRTSWMEELFRQARRFSNAGKFLVMHIGSTTSEISAISGDSITDRFLL
jgi:hypothetical protein